MIRVSIWCHNTQHDYCEYFDHRSVCRDRMKTAAWVTSVCWKSTIHGHSRTSCCCTQSVHHDCVTTAGCYCQYKRADCLVRRMLGVFNNDFLYKTFPIIKLSNEILKLNLLAVWTQHTRQWDNKTMRLFAMRYTMVNYSVSGALEQLELELVDKYIYTMKRIETKCKKKRVTDSSVWITLSRKWLAEEMSLFEITSETWDKHNQED